MLILFYEYSIFKIEIRSKLRIDNMYAIILLSIILFANLLIIELIFSIVNNHVKIRHYLNKKK